VLKRVLEVALLECQGHCVKQGTVMFGAEVAQPRKPGPERFRAS